MTVRAACTAHHWRIAEPSGPTSAARCMKCGPVRVFRNWLQEGDFLTGEEKRFASAA